MIIGVGVDIVEVQRISRSLERWGARFTNRILSPDERRRHTSESASSAYLARQFAAKEAVSKALGTGMNHGVHFAQIQVLRQQSGGPYVRLTGSALAAAEQAGIRQIHISISDEKQFAVAYAIAEGDVVREDDLVQGQI